MAVKRNYSALTLEEAMQLIGQERFCPWQPDAPPRQPSDHLKEDLRRLEAFDLQSTEQAKTLLIDALLAEVLPDHPKLKAWKAAVLNTETLTGVADYLVAPNRAYLAAPLMCVVEAKRDDFERGQVQCVAEMHACQWTNRQRGHDTDVFGVVSNGQGWVFYQLTREGNAYETDLLAMSDLPRLLGVLDAVCEACEKAVPGPGQAPCPSAL